MPTTITQLFAVPAAPADDLTLTTTGNPVPGPVPPAAVWPAPLSGSALLPTGAGAAIELDTPLVGADFVIDVVVRCGASGTLLAVDDRLWLRMRTGAAGSEWGLTAAYGGDVVDVASAPDPAWPAGSWVRVQLVMATDQLAVLAGGTVVARVPLASQFSSAESVSQLVVTNDDTIELGLAVLSISDTLDGSLAEAVRLTEAAGVGEIRGAFHRVGEDVIGSEIGPETAIPGGRMQQFKHGSVYWSARSGGVVLDGPVAQRYHDMGAHTSGLGLPLTDAQPGTAPYSTRQRAAKPWEAGDKSRMIRFEHGVIAWSEETGAHEVWGRVAEHWLVIGGPSSPVGLPIGHTGESRYGLRHGFQYGDVFEMARGGVAEVHGAILERYDELDAWNGLLGPPLTDEKHVLDDLGVVTGGRISHFEHGVIIWSPTTGAHEVLGDWWVAYRDHGGPGGELGLPTSGLHSMPSGVEYIEFEHGLIVKHTTTGLRVVTAIELSLHKAEAPSIDDGWHWDSWVPSRDRDAELIVWMTVNVNGSPLPGWDGRRFPSSGHAGRTVTVGDSLKIPVRATTTIELVGRAKDWDLISSDDELGGIRRSYGLDSLWGELGPLGPSYEETGTGGDGPVVYHYSIGLPAGVLSDDFREDRWWNFRNTGTDELSYDLYSRAFEDVEAHGDWWDTVSNPLDHLFYEIAIKGVAGSGNCYGMCNLALRSLAGSTSYRPPLNRYGSGTVVDATFPGRLRESLNVAHAQQLDAAVIGYALSHLFAGAVDVLELVTEVLDGLRGGRPGVVSMLKMGSGHSVVCYGTTPRPGFPDSLLLADPNVPYARSTDPTASRIEFDGAGGWTFFDNATPSDTYSSSEWAIMLRIPDWVVRAPSITPMAALGLGVEQILNSITILGGDVGYESVGGVGGEGSVERLPLLQASPTLSVFAGTGPVPPSSRAILVSRDRGVQARAYMRSANAAGGAEWTFSDRGETAHVQIDHFDTGRPSLTAELPQAGRATLHLAGLVGAAQRPGFAASIEATVGGPGQRALFEAPPVGAGVTVDGLVSGPAPMLTLYPSGGERSRYRLDAAEPGRKIQVHPADMASPFGSQVIHGLGTEIVVAPVL